MGTSQASHGPWWPNINRQQVGAPGSPSGEREGAVSELSRRHPNNPMAPQSPLRRVESRRKGVGSAWGTPSAEYRAPRSLPKQRGTPRGDLERGPRWRRGADRRGQRDGRRGRPGSARGGGTIGPNEWGEQEGAQREREKEQDGGRASAMAALGPAVLTRLRGTRRTIAAAASHKGPGPPCPARRGGGAAGRGQTLHPPSRSPHRPGPPPPPGPQRPPPSRRRQRPPPLGRSAPSRPGGGSAPPRRGRAPCEPAEASEPAAAHQPPRQAPPPTTARPWDCRWTPSGL